MCEKNFFPFNLNFFKLWCALYCGAHPVEANLIILLLEYTRSWNKIGHCTEMLHLCFHETSICFSVQCLSHSGM